MGVGVRTCVLRHHTVTEPFAIFGSLNATSDFMKAIHLNRHNKFPSADNCLSESNKCF